jgi:FdhE protein
MKNASILSEEYQQLQETLIHKQEQWKKSLNADSYEVTYDKAAMEAGVPIASFTSFKLNFPLFVQWVDEVKGILSEQNAQTVIQFEKLVDLLDEATANTWLEEAIAFNSAYFEKFAADHGIDTWIPHFVAETVIRPYLQILSEKAEQKITTAVPGCGCPVCGEPVRLGQLEGKGQKVLHCPRCLAKWLDKKLSCAHCGNDNNETTKYLTIEGRATEQIHVCEECKGYTKIIDTRQYLKKPSTPMLDLNTIHLDYIAQENGYQVMGEKEDNI